MIIAKITSTEPIISPSFKYADGTLLEKTPINDTTWAVTVGDVLTSQKIYAYDDLGAKIGKVNLSVYAEKERNLVVVPVNGATVPEDLQEQINTTFAQANVSFSVTTAENYENDTYDADANGLQSPDASLMSKYSLEMRSLRDAYFEENGKENNTYYLFVVPEFDSDLQGYIVRGKAVGFIQSNETTHTYSHELAHGAFGLEHTFPEIPTSTTQNLLDYTENGTHLTHDQWYAIQHFTPVFSVLDDEEDGGMAIVNTNDYSDIFNLANPDGSITFLSPAGQPITINGTISQLVFTTYEDRWRNLETGETYEELEVPIGALAGFTVDGIEYAAKGSPGGLFSGYRKVGTEIFYEDSLSILPNHTPVILTPSYSFAGFAAKAFRINQTTTAFSLDSLNTASGTIGSHWDFLSYINHDSIRFGETVIPNFTYEFSFNTLTILSNLAYNNYLVEPTYDYILYDSPYISEYLEGAGDLLVEGEPAASPDEIYVGYEALMLYNAGYFIQELESADACFINFEAMASYNTENALFNAYYQEQTQDVADVNDGLDGATGLGNDRLVYYSLPSAEVYSDARLYGSEGTIDYKRDRIERVFGSILYYNALMESFEGPDPLSDLESEIFVHFLDVLDEHDELGDCLMLLLNAETKLKILNRTREWDYTYQDYKEELIVRVVENTTNEQFEEMYLAQGDCSLLHMLDEDLWFSQYDRFANRLTYLLLEYKTNQGYVEEELPVFPLFADGLNPMGTEVENDMDGCQITFDAQIVGYDNDVQNSFNADELVLFSIEDYFDFPGFDGTFLEMGDTLLAPAYWAYYFLGEHDDQANLELLRYFAEATLIVFTAGTSITIELGILGADFVMSGFREEYPDNEYLEYIHNSVIALSVIIPVTATNKIVRNGITKMPWIHSVGKGADRIITFTKNELGDFIHALHRNKIPVYEALSALDELIDALRHAEYLAPAKNTLLTYLLKAQLDIAASTFCRTLNNGRLVVEGGRIFVQLEQDLFGFSKGHKFEIGHCIQDPLTKELYVEDLSIFPGVADETLKDVVFIDDILVKQDGVLSYESYRAVLTEEGQMYLVRLGDELVGFSKLEDISALGTERFALLEDALTGERGIKFEYGAKIEQYPVDFLNERGDELYEIVFDNGELRQV